MRAIAATCTGGASSRYGPVVLVAEQHGVDAFVDEDLEVAAHVVDRALDARRGVVQRRAGQRRHVRHRDHRPGGGEDPSEALAHGSRL